MFYDRATIDGPARITRDGYLVADALVGRADNIQDYQASELGLTDRAPTDIVRIFRPASEVFAKDALGSLAHRPVTLGHPADGVNADNWRNLAVGDVGSDILRDGEFVRVPLKVMDKAAVDSIRTDRQEFSLGYTAVVDMTPGEHAGQVYDGRMGQFRFNHLAAVRAARGGTALRIIDERPDYSKETNVKTIVYDGVPVKLDDAAAVEAILAKAIDAKAIADKAVADSVALLDAEKGKVAILEKQLADAKAASDPAALDKRVADRASLVSIAKALKSDIVTDGKADGDIRKEVVAASGADVTAMSDEAVSAVFAFVAKDAKAVTDASATVHNIGTPLAIGDAQADYAKAQAARKAAISDAWKQPASAAA